MTDVGHAAEVSAQTVSRYFTGGYVSPQARIKIETAVRDLGYSRSRLPQILRAERTGTLGFLAMGPVHYGNASILTGIGRAAMAAGQSLLTTQADIAPSDHDTMRQVLQNLLAMRVDGIVVGTPYQGIEDLLRETAAFVPVVQLSEVSTPGVTAVHADSYGAARDATAHLIELGHTRILHLAGPLERNESAERIRGYHDALAAAGLGPLPIRRCGDWGAADGAEVAADADPATFTAVLAANDHIALGFMSVLRGRGFTAPGDYSIAGIDGMPEARYYAPALTSSVLDFVKVGEIGLRTILDRIGGRPDTGAIVVPSTLLVQASTGPVPDRGVRA